MTRGKVLVQGFSILIDYEIGLLAEALENLESRFSIVKVYLVCEFSLSMSFSLSLPRSQVYE